MTEELQRIRIAEARGWKHIGNRYYRHTLTSMPRHADCLPNYPRDLNAMHEAFKHLGRHWKIEQVEDGYVVTVQFGKRNKDTVVAGLELCPVMAEAFLRTRNLWEEGQ